MWNDDFLDNLAVLSFVIGLLNYNENLSQSDKDDIMHQLDVKTTDMLKRLEKDLEEQNDILHEQTEILKRLEKRDGS